MFHFALSREHQWNLSRLTLNDFDLHAREVRNLVQLYAHRMLNRARENHFRRVIRRSFQRRLDDDSPPALATGERSILDLSNRIGSRRVTSAKAKQGCDEEWEERALVHNFESLP